MTESIVKTRLEKSLQAGSLADLVKQRKQSRRTFILLDYSYSMDGPVSHDYSSMTRKIDALRSIDNNLKQGGVHVERVGFGNKVCFIDALPEPSGGTPMHDAITFSAQNGAEHLIVVSDGEPDDPNATRIAAKAFGGPIDVFYVGPPGGTGERFLEELCNTTGGQYQPADLAEQKQLETKIKGLLGA